MEDSFHVLTNRLITSEESVNLKIGHNIYTVHVY